MNKNFAEIIPLRRLIRNLRVFDYQIPPFLRGQIQIGQLVQISFQNTDFLGVVNKIKEKTSIPEERMKTINKIVQREPVITKEQFELIDFLTNYYFVAPSTILKSMIPPFPKKPIATYPKKYFPNKKVLTISKKVVPWLTHEVKKFLFNSKKPAFLTYPQKALFFSFYLGIIKKSFEENKITLILVPEIKELNHLYSLTTAGISASEIAFIHSGLSKSEYFYQWQRVLKNQVNIIIGTRIASFLPFSRLNTIIVHLEEDENHKQADQNPRFHVREVAKKLAQYYNARLLYTSQTPSLELFQEQKKGLVRAIIPPPFPSPKINLVSLEEELKKKNYSGISEELQKLISKTLEQNKSIFLFLNRRGLARAFICRDCNFIARCTECLLPFTVHEKNFLICHHCNKKISLFLECSNCGGPNLHFVGKGTQGLTQDLKKIFPNASVHQIDKDTPQKGEFSGIIIGTEYALHYLSIQDLGAIGIISADSLFYIPDFRSEEKTYQLITRVIHCSSRPSPVILETFSPENKTIQAVVKQDFISFARKELILRKKLHWPPYWQIIKLIYQQKDVSLAQKEAESLSRKLGKSLKKTDLIEIMGPLPSHPPRVRGKYRWVVILKSKNGHTAKLKEIINLVPEEWIIDVDPITLL